MERRINSLKCLPRNLLQTFKRVEKSTTDWLQQHNVFHTNDSSKPGTPTPLTRQQPKLQSTPLSFYDGFDCMGGVPAFHFTEGANDEVGAPENSSISKFQSHQVDAGASSSNPGGQAESSEDSGAKIIECTFSMDSSKFAAYFSSGIVKVWDTDHGKLIFKTSKMPSFHFCCLSLLDHSDGTWILLCTRDGRCVMWNMKTGEPKTIDFLDESKESYYNTEQLTHHQNAMFLSNGKKLMVSSLAATGDFPVLKLIIVDTRGMVSSDGVNCSSDGEVEWQVPLLISTPPRSVVATLSTPLDFNFFVTRIEMSPDQTGLLVAISDERLENGYCTLWTDFITKPQIATRLSKGTMGAWSTRNEFIVTWTFPEEPYPEENDCGCAFLWNLKEQCEPTEYTEVKNMLGRNILWCRFVLDMEGRDRLVMCVLETTATFLFWDIENKSLTHTIATSVLTKGATVSFREEWIRSLLKRRSVKGLSPIEVSMNMKQIGAVSECENRVMIWDAVLGVQRLDISFPESFRENYWEGMDIKLSPTQSKFVVISGSKALMFSPSTRFDLETEIGVSQMIELENPSGGTDSKNARFKMLFSHDGNTLGVLNVGSLDMTVWHLLKGETCAIASDLESGGFEDFCISSEGDFLVTCTSDRVICIWDCTREQRSVTESFKISSASIALGISSDPLEIVVCSREGTLLWYNSSNEVPRDSLTMLNSPRERTSFGSVPSFFQGGAHDRDLQVSGRLDEPLMPSRSNVRVMRHSRWHLAEEKESFHGEVLACRISTDCARAIRLCETGEAEVWDLKRKEMLLNTQGVNLTSIRTPHISQLLPLNGNGATLDGIRDGAHTSSYRAISTLDEATVLSENEDVFLAGVSLMPLAQNPTDSPDTLFQENSFPLAVSISVVNNKDPANSRFLKGRTLQPPKGLAISPDGRHVACVSGRFASKVTVWTCYASEELLPNYDSFALNYKSVENDVLIKELKLLLNKYGVSFMNCLHACGTSFLTKAILKSKSLLIKELLEHAVNCDIKISMFLMKDVCIGGTLQSKPENLVSVSLNQKAAETIKAMMKYLVKRVTQEHEVREMLAETLIPIGRNYTQILFDVVDNPNLFGSCSEIEIPTKDPPSEGFFTSNNSSLNLSRDELEEHRVAHCQKGIKRRGEIAASTAAVGALPYKGICQIGSAGLLRHMLAQGTDHAVFGAFAIKAIIACKWETYAKNFVLAKAMLHAVLMIAFITYGYCLSEYTTYDEDNDFEVEGGVRTDFILLICCFLAFLGLFGKLVCVLTFIREYKVKIYVLSPVFVTNLMDIISFTLLVVGIPTLHFRLWGGSSAPTILSSVVALVILFLWLRFFCYALPFASVGKVSIMAIARIAMLVPFMIFMLGVTSGFAVAFRVLYRTKVSEYKYYDTHGGAEEYLADIYVNFGTIPTCVDTLFAGVLLNSININILYNAPFPFLAIVFSYGYFLTMSYIFLTVASDAIGRQLNHIAGNSDTRFVALKAAVIDEIDIELHYWPLWKLKERLGGYLHAAIPKFLHGASVAGTERKLLRKRNTDLTEVYDAWVAKARGRPQWSSISKKKKEEKEEDERKGIKKEKNEEDEAEEEEEHQSDQEEAVLDDTDDTMDQEAYAGEVSPRSLRKQTFIAGSSREYVGRSTVADEQSLSRNVYQSLYELIFWNKLVVLCIQTPHREIRTGRECVDETGNAENGHLTIDFDMAKASRHLLI